MEYHIRPYRIEDAAAIAEAMDNPRVQNNLRDGIPMPYTEADGRAFIQSVLDAPIDSQYLWAIDVGGKAVGSLGIHRRENIHRCTAELGYYLAELYWGKGIMPGAVKEACAWAFANTDLLRIFAEPFALNKASCRVLEKTGFTFEGLLRQNAIKNGKVIDMKMYSLLKGEAEC